jgi:voltage-gated potassium channel
MVPVFRVARIARVARIIRVLRGVRASKHLLQFVLVHRARNTFLAVVFGSFVLLLFSVVAIVTVEPTFEPREAFWWCVFTLITGEYGDFYPQTVEGRVITVLLMTAGVALFGTFTASVASFFVEEEQEEDERRDEDMRQEIKRLTEEVSQLRKEMRGDKGNNQTGGEAVCTAKKSGVSI